MPDSPEKLPRLPARPADAHKGSCGTVAVVGGHVDADRVMIGAPALSARAALRAGTGLVRIVGPASLLPSMLEIEPSATGVPLPERGDVLLPHGCVEMVDRVVTQADCLAIGPGLGTGEASRAMSLRAIQQEEIPVVIDADALNCLAEVPELHADFRAAAVLTPHPGEYRRLARALRLKEEPRSKEDRLAAAEALAQRLGCVVVLKGEHSVVSDGLRSWSCGRGHPCLATAGTGDVLTGLIAGLVAQFVVRPDVSMPSVMRERMPPDARRPLTLFDAGRLAVEIHAIAGERWAQNAEASAGLRAQELADLLPGIVEEHRVR